MLEATPSPDCSASAPPENTAPPLPNASRSIPKSAFRTPPLPPPPWQKISGLFPDKEAGLSRSERRYALRKLFRHFEQLVRDALAEHQTDPEKDERTFLWDPLAMICIELGIARRKLSALTKELNGMSASEVVDRIRAAELPAKLEEALALLVRYDGGDYEVRDRLLAGKSPTGRDLGHWACQHGFATYQRFRRGCMLAHGGQTPRLLERATMEKFSAYFYLVKDLHRRGCSMNKRLDSWGSPDTWRLETAGQPFQDKWAQAQREKGEWLARMRELLGMHKDCVEAAAAECYPPLTPKEEAYVKAYAEQQRANTPPRE